ncbi:MAG: ParA family protein [Longimicrobiales bacterium]
MRILATYNIKGGVGKTASAVNLAYLAARAGTRTLVWDLDPQGAASFYFRVKPRVKGGGRKLIQEKTDVDSRIKATDFPGLDLLPADFSYRHLDLELDQTRKPVKQIGRILAPLSREYELLIIDCAPSISLVSESVFRAADVLLVPTIPTPLSLRTLLQLLRSLETVRAKRLGVYPFFCMVDRRKALHRSTADLSQDIPIPFLRSQIPYSSLVEQMGAHRAPIHTFARSSPPALAYEKLWREILQWLRKEKGYFTKG